MVSQCDSVRVIEAFHASPVAGIQTFHRACHFGSRRQALAAVGAHFWLDYPARKVTPVYLYQVTITVGANALLDGPAQWGALGASGIALELNALSQHPRAAHLRWELPPAERSIVFLHAAATSDDGGRAEAFWQRHLPAVTPAGVQVLRYINTSAFDQLCPQAYCVLDPAVVGIRTVAQVPVNDVIEATYLHADHADGRRAMAAYCRDHQLRTNDWLRGG